MEAKRVSLKDVKWLQPDEDIYYLGGHFEMMAYLVFKKDMQLGSMKQALEFMKNEVGQTIKQMIEKVAQDDSVIDKEELVTKICEVTEWKQDSEVFKFLGLSQ